MFCKNNFYWAVEFSSLQKFEEETPASSNMANWELKMAIEDLNKSLKCDFCKGENKKLKMLRCEHMLCQNPCLECLAIPCLYNTSGEAKFIVKCPECWEDTEFDKNINNIPEMGHSPKKILIIVKRRSASGEVKNIFNLL